MQHIEHLAWTPGRDNKKIQKNSTDTRLIVVTLESRMSEVRCLSSCRSQTPTVSFLSSFSTTPTFQKHNTIKKPKASFTSPLLHLVRSESKTEVRSRPWLQDQISTDTVLHSHHNATNWTSCLNTWQREHKSRNLSWQDWVCHAEESDVRGEMSVFMPKSDSTASFLSSFYATPCYQTVVDTMKKKKLLQDAATTPCSRRKLEPEFQWHGQLANRLNIWQRIQITLPTLLTQGWSSPRCGFWCQRWDVGLHVRFRFPLCLSFRHFFTTPTFETFHTVENPKHLSCRRYSTWYEANQKQRWVLDLDSRIRFPLTPSYPHITMQPFAHLAWTPGRENKNPETSTDKVEFATLKVRCQRRDGLSSCRSQILTKIFPLAILCETKFRNLEPESEQSNVSVPIRLVRSGRRKPFVISRSLLWSHLLTATILKSKRKSTNHSFARLRERLTQCSLPECSPPSKY